MSSAAQIQANQQNARKSTGPVTEDGKEASSQNATKHGIFARIIPDAEDGFPELLDSIREDFQPNGGMESTIVEQVALAYFRLQRLYAYEQQACTLRDSAQHDLEALDYEAREQGVKLPVIGIISVLAGEAARVATFKGYAESPANARLIRYEAMLNRQIQRNLELLNTIQAARKAREEKVRRKADDRRIRDLKDRMGNKAFHELYVYKDRTLDEIEALLAVRESTPPAEPIPPVPPAMSFDEKIERAKNTCARMESLLAQD